MGTKIKCIIIEDEPMASKLLSSYIEKMDTLELVASFDNPTDYIATKENIAADLIFLDICMPEMDGISFLRMVPLYAEVIITTASQDYALKCYPLKVIDYLLKPFRYNRFVEAVNFASEVIELKRNQKKQKNNKLLWLKVDKKLIKVQTSDVLYIEAAWEYVKVCTKKQSFMVLAQMKDFEKKLDEYNIFCRIHRSFLINMEHISYIEGNIVYINDNISLPISRNYKNTLFERLKD
ncbi:MAG: LytTR family DNA-binding domain-containing protein [Flavobacteriaceae bacterium]|jgi:DNA-binding LytR/AlgR family response regulator|nr:LytTR family DNA-binding domain-containing protein [Flavobacteriaceae bacterium]